jgi:hypothetical protein
MPKTDHSEEVAGVSQKHADHEIHFLEPADPDEVEIPEQKDFYQLPVRFGAVPVDEAPLGWEVETRRRETKVTKFQHAYPTVRLPFQEVKRVEFGHNDDFTSPPLAMLNKRPSFPPEQTAFSSATTSTSCASFPPKALTSST